jgi:hypothetical protein
VGYILEAIRTHPFNAITLLIAAAAFVYARISAKAARDQAVEAKRSREVSERALHTQIHSLTKQAEDGAKMAAIAKESASAAKKSAEAAEQTVQVMRLISETDLRAWVQVQNHKTNIVGRMNVGPIPQYLVTSISNGGRTPALNLTIFQSFLVLEGSFPEEPDYLDQLTASSGPLGAGVSFEHKTDISLLPQQEGEINDGALFLYVYGYAKYHDIFETDNWHYTKWCLAFDPDTREFANFFAHNRMT